MDLREINRNLKFVYKKEIPHKIRNELLYQFIGVRKKYLIMSNVSRKKSFNRSLKMIRKLSYRNLNTLIVTEFIDLKLLTKRTLIQKNEWTPGFLLRYYGIKKKNEIRQFPLMMVNISLEERSIPILEALKLHISTFSFTNMTRKSFLVSDYKYAINFRKNKFSNIIVDTAFVDTINTKYY